MLMFNKVEDEGLGQRRCRSLRPPDFVLSLAVCDGHENGLQTASEQVGRTSTAKKLCHVVATATPTKTALISLEMAPSTIVGMADFI